ncbi:major facilitator transporter [Oscillochloris trichoides DG-6]|uniref:Major facilitator transporter n=1 Tax=Oscillochloris trichoides DG-6 TaxID=765420 RepID=E1IE78_9CHLR|nr:MFS transporter [Oscillochloris trichoides]EFO80538.1 major facilitator transporter [Oscillochloris trichoides DG-6]
MLAMRAHLSGGKISSAVWFILLHSSLFGLALSIADILFNFYLVSLGYTVATAGLFSTIGRAAGMLMGIPLGIMIDRIGAQRSLLIGVAIYGLGWAILLQFTSLWIMIPIQFLIGAAFILTSTAVTPLLAGVTNEAQRATIFGWNASATMAVGLGGSVLGGVLPSLAAGMIEVGPQDTAAYRMALMVVVGLCVIAMLPILSRMQPVAHERPHGAAPLPTSRLPMARLGRFSIAGLLLGMGGGAFLPFQNLFFRDVFLLSDVAVGLVLAWGAMGMGVGGMLGGPMAGWLGLQRAATITRMGAVFSMLLMLTPSLIIASIGFFWRGLSIAASYPLNDALIMRATPLRQRGIAASMMSVFWSGGWAAAAWTSGVVLEHWGFTPVIIFAAVAYFGSALAIATLRGVEG